MHTFRQLCLLFLFSIFLITSCASQRFYLAQDTDKPGRIPSYETYQHYIAFGLLQNQDMNLNDACKGTAISFIETQYNFLSVLAFTITYGFYVPKKVNIYCELSK